MGFGMGKPLLTILLLGALFLARNAIQSADETLREQEIILRQLTQEIQTHLKSLSTPQSSPQQPPATKQIPALNTKERFLEIISPPQSPSEKPLAEDNRWLEKVALKINCLKQRRGSTFFYHTRKAGGTTIHDWLRSLSSQWRVPYYELEGKSLNPRLLLEPGVLSVTSLRDPIDRILSLYWYEHVSWWYDVKDEPQNCRTLAQWVDGWRDGSTWKAHFVKQNPGTVYIEVENYYVKSLIGWDGSAPIGEADLERAKSILSEDFDFVLFTEDMASDLFGSLSLLSKIFGSSTNALKKKRNKSDQTTRQRLESQLAKDQASVIQILTDLNQFDLELFKFAKVLTQRRSNAVLARAHRGLPQSNDCQTSPDLPKKYRNNLGLHRPIGHKGPLDRLPSGN